MRLGSAFIERRALSLVGVASQNLSRELEALLRLQKEKDTENHQIQEKIEAKEREGRALSKS